MAYVRIGNPIVSCQYRLHGGAGMLAKTFVYAAVVVGIIVLYHRVEAPIATVSTTALMALEKGAWLQAIILVLGGAGAIARGLTRDQSTRVIESYRMSPLGAFRVVTGYMFGCTLQILLLYAVGVVLGLGLCVLASISLRHWLLGNFFLLASATSIWSLAVFAGVGAGKPTNLMPLFVLGSALSPVIMNFAPGLALFMGSYAIGRSIEYMLGRTGPASGLGVAFGISALMTVFWGWAAARRYRRPHLPALGIVGALLFVALWLTMFVTGLRLLERLLPPGWQLEQALLGILVMTLLSPCLVAHLPVAAAVQIRRRQILGARPADWGERIAPWAAGAASIGLMLIMIGVVRFTAVFPAPSGPPGPAASPFLELRVWGVTATALILALVTVAGLLRLSYFTTGRSLLASVGAVLLWGLPPLIDHLLVSFSLPQIRIHLEDYSFLLGCSPWFSIGLACVYPAYPVVPGLVFQLATAAGATLLGNRAERLLIQKRARLRTEEAEQFGPPSPGEAGAEPLASLQPAGVAPLG